MKRKQKMPAVAMNFMTEWDSIKDRKVLPSIEMLVGATVRFRNNALDRKKLYVYHSPAVEVVRAFVKNGVFRGTSLAPDVLTEDEWKREGFDRFLTFRILYGFRSDNEKEVVCAYITLHIEPCEVEPLRKGGIAEGSRITGYDITVPEGSIMIDENTTIHDLMNIDAEYYYSWLYYQIALEYERAVKAVTACCDFFDEKKAEENIHIMKNLCDGLEENVILAKKLLCLI